LCNDAWRRTPKKTSRKHLRRYAIVVPLSLGCTGLAAQQRPQSPSTPAAYTAAQAAAGEKFYFAPGYRMLALDARTGTPVPSFGNNGAVDLKLEAARRR
jgi:glucose dehydrogenase